MLRYYLAQQLKKQTGHRVTIMNDGDPVRAAQEGHLRLRAPQH